MAVYFIQQGDDGPVKIGSTTGPVKNRLRTLRTSSPHHLVLRLVLSGTSRTETELHHRFAALRMEREWFRPAPELLTFMASPQGYAIEEDAVALLGNPLQEPARAKLAEIGQAIRGAREDAGVSQAALATKIGMQRENLIRVEKGRMNLTVETMVRVSEGLGVNLTVTFGPRSARAPQRRPPA